MRSIDVPCGKSTTVTRRIAGVTNSNCSHASTIHRDVVSATTIGGAASDVIVAVASPASGGTHTSCRDFRETIHVVVDVVVVVVGKAGDTAGGCHVVQRR